MYFTNCKLFMLARAQYPLRGEVLLSGKVARLFVVDKDLIAM